MLTFGWIFSFSLVSARTRVIFETIGNICVVIFGGIYSYYAVTLVSNSLQMREVDPVYPAIVVWPAKAAMLIGTILLSLQALRLVVSNCQLLYEGRLEGSEKSWDNPRLLIPVFLSSVIIGLFILKMNSGLGLAVLLVTLLFSGVPVAFGLGIMGTIGLFVGLGTKSLIMVPNIGYGNLNQYALISLPLFILAGQIIEKSGMSERIFRASSAFIGNIPGGLGAATILSCGVFASISGSSVANAGTMGMIAIPQLIRLGYDRRLAYGLVAAGGTLGILIPPSAGMILFGVVTDESIGKLFMAGLIPGIILMMLFMAGVIVLHTRGKKHNKISGKTVTDSWRERLGAVKDAWAALMLPVIIIGGMYSGVFTATEAAAVAVVYSIAATVIPRAIKLSDWPNLIRDCTKNIAMIMMIFVGAMILGGFLTAVQIPQSLTAAIVGANLSTWSFVAIIILFLFLIGMFMEAGAVTLVVIPVLYPVIQALGINALWFAVFFVINMEIACISPPVGLNLYIIQRVAGARFGDVVRGTLWFYPIIFAILILVLIFPKLSLWLPGTMG